MKALSSILLVFLLFHLANGQVAIIQDADGWTNVREAANQQAKSIHVIYENEVFWYDYDAVQEGQEWVAVYFPKHDYGLGNSDAECISGFIHNSRILPLERMKTYEGEAFSFAYRLSPFEPKGRIIDLLDQKWIIRMDGRPVWGTDGTLPTVQVDAIEANIDGQKISVHEVFYNDLFECDNQFSVYKRENTYILHQWNSDGAGAYELVWVFDKNGLKQRLVGNRI